MNAEFMSSPWFTYGLVPGLIFLARVLDVSVGTLRLIFVSKGRKFLAPLLGFFEVMVWLGAIGQIMQNLTNPVCYLAYALGFALGNFVGIWLEERMAPGYSAIRVITQRDSTKLLGELRRRSYGVTVLRGEGGHGPVNVIYIVLRRKFVPHVLATIQRYNPNAFLSVKEVRMARGVTLMSTTSAFGGLGGRKGK